MCLNINVLQCKAQRRQYSGSVINYHYQIIKLLTIQYLQPANADSEDPLALEFAQAAAALKERLEEHNMPIDDKVAK